MGTHEDLAKVLLQARRTHVAAQPPRTSFLNMTLHDAYRIQQLQEQEFVASGDPIVGRKIGLTSAAMQKQFGVDEPDFGFVTRSMAFQGDAEFPPGQFLAPKVEPELALTLGKDLGGPGVDLETAMEAVESVHAAIEIIDSRVAGWDIKLVDSVADNASCGAIAVSRDSMDVNIADLARLQCRLLLDGDVVAEGAGADVMGHPVAPLAWLANTLGERGVTLSAGEVVLTGSFTASFPVRPGGSATADFGEYGRLSVTF